MEANNIIRTNQRACPCGSGDSIAAALSSPPTVAAGLPDADSAPWQKGLPHARRVSAATAATAPDCEGHSCRACSCLKNPEEEKEEGVGHWEQAQREWRCGQPGPATQLQQRGRLSSGTRSSGRPTANWHPAMTESGEFIFHHYHLPTCSHYFNGIQGNTPSIVSTTPTPVCSTHCHASRFHQVLLHELVEGVKGREGQVAPLISQLGRQVT